MVPLHVCDAAAEAYASVPRRRASPFSVSNYDVTSTPLSRIVSAQAVSRPNGQTLLAGKHFPDDRIGDLDGPLLPFTSAGVAISQWEQEQPSSSAVPRPKPLHDSGSSCSHSQVEVVSAPRRRIDRSLRQALGRRPAVLRQFRNRTRCSTLKLRTLRSRNRLRPAGCRGHGGRSRVRCLRRDSASRRHRRPVPP
jgi:hypothetical protein